MYVIICAAIRVISDHMHVLSCNSSCQDVSDERSVIRPTTPVCTINILQYPVMILASTSGKNNFEFLRKYKLRCVYNVLIAILPLQYLYAIQQDIQNMWYHDISIHLIHVESHADKRSFIWIYISWICNINKYWIRIAAIMACLSQKYIY